MSNQTPRKSKSTTQQDHVFFSRGARLGFLFLLFITVIFAIGALLLTYQLDHFKEKVESELQAKVSENLTIGSVSINGLRGLVISDLQVSLPFTHGPEITIEVPEALLNLDMNSLMSGKLILGQLELNNAQVDIFRPAESNWFSGAGAPSMKWDTELSEFSESLPFQITGNNANVTVHNIVNENKISLDNINFSIARQAGSAEISATLKGNLLDNPQKAIQLKATYASLDDFYMRIDQSQLTAEDISIVFPSDTPQILSGEISPSIRIYGGTDNVIIVNMKASFNNLLLRDQLDFLDATTGELNVLASYDTAVQELEITTAKVEADQIDGSIDGSIYFSQASPLFDLKLLCTRLPFQDMIDSTLEERIAQYGILELDLGDEQLLTVTVQGTSNSPIINSEISSTGGTLRYTPNNSKLPPIELSLGPISGGWDTLTEEGSGSIDIISGSVRHEASNIEASNITGTLTLANKKLRIAPLNAIVTGNTIVGTFEYDLETQDSTITLEGTVKGLEDTSYANAIKNLTLGGSLNFKCEGRKRGNEFFLEADVDASQTKLDYMWFYTKAANIGAIGKIKAHFIPEKSYSLEFTSQIASSDLSAVFNSTYFDSVKKYKMMETHLTSTHLDIPTVGAGINMPYRITGTTGSDAYLDWVRDPSNWEYSTLSYGAHFDEVSLLPQDDNAKETIQLKNATIALTSQNSESFTGTIKLDAAEMNTPPLTSTWFVPVTPPDAYPTKPREWTYAINAKTMSLPPWKGTNFASDGYSSPKEIGFNAFSATIDGGKLEGSYHANREENSYTNNLKWSGIPIHYFLAHMNYDEIMSGTIDGSLNYSIDKDDPNTLQGKGNYIVKNGQFHPRFLQSLLGSEDAESTSTLPATLDFKTLDCKIELEKDEIRIPTITLDSDKIKILGGSGKFIQDGAIDFTIPMSISPEMAATIPSMAKSFNLSGYKAANANINLGFHITGTTSEPEVEVEALPSPGVAISVGLIGAGKEVIDLPRKLLRDLFKMGGGIVKGGAKK